MAREMGTDGNFEEGAFRVYPDPAGSVAGTRHPVDRRRTFWRPLCVSRHRDHEHLYSYYFLAETTMTHQRLLSSISAILLTAASCVFLSGCFPNDPMDAEMTRLISRTSPDNSVILLREDPQQQGGHSRASWTFRWRGGWNAYTDWVKQNLVGSYGMIQSDNNALAFRRKTAQGFFTVVIEPCGVDNQTRVTLIGEKL
jgi:hypothetical protein